MNADTSHNDSVDPHPTVTELAEYVRSQLGPRSAASIASHLDSCLICRARVQRLADAPSHAVVVAPDAPSALDDVVPDALRRAADADEDSTPVSAGQLWRAAHHEGLLIWIRRVVDDQIAVMPVVLDAEFADDLTLIVPADATPVASELAVMTELETQIDRRSLRHFIAELPIMTEVEALRRARRDGIQAAGLLVGLPIESPLDQRLEYRQAIAETLADFTADAYDELPAETAYDDAIDLHDLHAQLRHLAERRPDMRIVEVEPHVQAVDSAHRLFVAATVDELGAAVAVAVLTGPRAPNLHTSEPLAATCLRVREALLDVDAVAVAITDTGWTTVVVAGADAQPAVEPPSGAHTPPRVAFEPLSLADALMKYFERSGSGWQTLGEAALSVDAADVPAIIRDNVRAAVTDVAAQGRRAVTPAKKDAYTAIGDAEQTKIESALRDIVRGEHPEEVLRRLLDPPAR